MRKKNKGWNSPEDTEAFTKIHTKLVAVEVTDLVDGELVSRKIEAPENTELTPQNIELLKNKLK